VTTEKIVTSRKVDHFQRIEVAQTKFPKSIDQFIRTLYAGCKGVVWMAEPLAAGAWAMSEWKPGRSYGSSPYVCISTVHHGVPCVDVEETDEAVRDWRRGKLRKRKTDCVQTAVIMLDDVLPGDATGGKVPAGRIALEPTYKLETSRGNFQYGYKLTEPVSPRDALPLIEAIRRAGLTDKGAGGVNRVMRVPGSINAKPGRDGWVAVLREWHPERTFTLEEIAAGLGVTPVWSVDPVGRGRVSNTDLVLEKLADEVVDSTHANSEGWWFIQCPWSHEHSDGRTDAKYLPSPMGAGTFHCFHSACEQRRTRDLIAYLIDRDPAFKEALRLPAPALVFPMIEEEV
jgi:hypothetical protein